MQSGSVSLQTVQISLQTQMSFFIPGPFPADDAFGQRAVEIEMAFEARVSERTPAVRILTSL
jgi:hypothetical protein